MVQRQRDQGAWRFEYLVRYLEPSGDRRWVRVDLRKVEVMRHLDTLLVLNSAREPVVQNTRAVLREALRGEELMLFYLTYRTWYG